eukprot:4702316-Pleurochrysis_carterae.AAC.1
MWRRTPKQRLEWAAALLAHNALLRGGEAGHPLGRAFDGTRDLTWASLTRMGPCVASSGHDWVV